MIPPALISFAARIGIRGGIIAALVLFGAVQTWRLSGTKGDLAACEADKAQMVQASAIAGERAVAARNAAQQRYSELAKDADHELEQVTSSAMADARAFIARARRVQSGPADRPSGRAIAAASDSLAGSPMPTDPAAIVDDTVAVPASDVLICTDNTIRLEAAQSWAASLNP